MGASGSLGSFVYDGLNRRQTATLDGNPTCYLHSGDDIVPELPDGNASASELDGLSTDERYRPKGQPIGPTRSARP